MRKIVHKASTRGHAKHGWLNTYHTFSFANYYNADRMHFGVLRVLNDDVIDGGEGFGEHPHDNMEIITVILDGALEHKDSMGNIHVLKKGDIQVMSAGTGITHSEYNNHQTEQVHLLQLWIYPDEQNVDPRYDQKEYPANERTNQWQTIVGPKGQFPLWIHQNAWLKRSKLHAGESLNYESTVKGNGIYIFVIQGEIELDDELLQARDGIGIHELDKLSIKSISDAEILLLDIPMRF